MNLADFYKGKKVLVTGHTGFKGAWMCKLLLEWGADVTGYALNPPTDPNLFEILKLGSYMRSICGDIRNLQELLAVMKDIKPEIVIHMAAQPLVRESYKDPVYTFETNVMGTVNVLEAVRQVESVRSVVNVTTDKVYRNLEDNEHNYREEDELNGFDPYSNSKSCSELVTSSYSNSFFAERQLAVSTVRAGNVIGGGDFASDRIIPDCFRAAAKGENIVVRNPNSVRPYQHVLEPVVAYLMIAARQYENQSFAGNYNIGPDDRACLTTGELATLFCSEWNKAENNCNRTDTNHGITWKHQGDNGPHEANFLKLDCGKAARVFGWKPIWDAKQTVQYTVEWYKAYHYGKDVDLFAKQQIALYLECAGNIGW